MKYTPTTDKFHDTIHLVDQTTPVQGGTPVFDAQGNPIKGASNASRVQLADNIAYLKKVLETATTVVDGETTSTLATYVKETRSDVDALDVRADDLDANKSVKFANYAVLGLYSGSATAANITNAGIAGPFYRRGNAAANGITVLKDALGRSWERSYDTGAIHAGWAGAKTEAGFDNTAAIQAAHDYCASSPTDKKVLFGAGQHEFYTTLSLRGIVEWCGAAPGGVGTNLVWKGSASVAIALDPKDWAGNYQGTFKNLRVLRGAGASRAVAFDLIRCSEYEFTSVYVEDMGTAFRFSGAPLHYFDRIVTSNCDIVFDYVQGSGLFVNAFHVISRSNFWESHDCVIRLSSGDIYSVFFNNTWVERFDTFMKGNPEDLRAFSAKDFRVTNCHMLSIDAANTRLVYYKAKPGNVACSITRFSFENCIVALNSSDFICSIDSNGNTSANTFLFGDLSFHNVHAYGAPTALVYSNKYGTTVRVTGDTLAQQGYYFGDKLTLAFGSARAVETNAPQFYAAAWSGDGAVQPAIGNGAIDAGFTVLSGIVQGSVAINFGSTTAPGDGVWKVSIPQAGNGQISGSAVLTVPGVGTYTGTVIGGAGNGYFQIVANTTGFTMPYSITPNAVTTLAVSFAYNAA